MLFLCPCPGPGASDRQTADRNVPRPPETDQLRGIHRSPVHTRASPGQSFHLEDCGLQPPHPVSVVRVCLLVMELQPIKMQSEALVGQM